MFGEENISFVTPRSAVVKNVLHRTPKSPSFSSNKFGSTKFERKSGISKVSFESPSKNDECKVFQYGSFNNYYGYHHL